MNFFRKKNKTKYLEYYNYWNNKSSQLYDYKNVNLLFPNNIQDKYEIIKQIGKGGYSQVYEGIQLDNGKKVAIKILNHSKIDKINREVMVLQHIKQTSPYISNIIDFGQDPGNQSYFFIFDYFSQKTLKNFVEVNYNLKDVAKIISQILQGIQTTHENGIFHRDIKLGNILINKKNDIQIIDWGLAEFFHPNYEYNLRVSTRPYKCPEILMGIQKYDFSFDMWNIGQLLSCLIFKLKHLIYGKDDSDQLILMMKFYGTKQFQEYCNEMRLTIPETFKPYFIRYYNDEPQWQKMVNKKNFELYDVNAISLIEKLLQIKPYERLTPKEALEHEFFKKYL